MLVQRKRESIGFHSKILDLHQDNFPLQEVEEVSEELNLVLVHLDRVDLEEEEEEDLEEEEEYILVVLYHILVICQ